MITPSIWFTGIVFLISILFIWIIQQSRIRKLQNQKAKLEQEVNERTRNLVHDVEKSKEVAETLRVRIQELATLNEIGRALSSAININELLELIYNQTTRIMEVSAFYLALYHRESNELQVIFDVLNGNRQSGEEATRKFGNGRTEYIIRTQQPLLIQSNPQQTYRQLGIISGDKKAKACVGVPLIHAGKTIGALVVQSYSFDHAYNEGHISLLSTIANQAAIAIENARLFQRIQEELQERKKIEERLYQRNADLITAKKDTDNILNNVKDGLFLIDQNFKIASQYSAALEKILEQTLLAGKDIIEYLQDKIDVKSLQAFKEYLKLLFNNEIEEITLEDLNPLSRVQLQFRDQDVKLRTKYLTFDFRRIYNNSVLSEIIVSVNDISQQVELAKNLEITREQNKRQMEWLFAILNVDGQMLDEFMRSSEEELSVIQTFCKSDRVSQSVDDIYRSVHCIKGNASMLELNFIATEAHAVEELLISIRGKLKPDSENVIKVKTDLGKFFEIFSEIRGLIERLHQFHTRFRPTRKHETEALFNSIANLIKNLSTQYNKEVILNAERYDASIVPHPYRLLIRDILVQLTRNSLYHGIESVDQRLAKNKNRQGHIFISDSREEDWFVLCYKDDGTGIPIARLRELALNSGQWSLAEIKEWSDHRIAELIFLPGMTTTEKADITAGRGMGMNIIKKKIEKVGGSIEIDFQADQFSQFTIRFPSRPESE